MLISSQVAMEELLPREIEVDIFSRLPAETLIPCKRVCRTWRDLFNDKHFIDAHLRRQSNAGFGVEDDHSYYHKKRSSSRSIDSEEDAVNKGSSHSRNSEDAANSNTSKVSFLILGGSYFKGQNKSFYYGNYSDEKQEFTYKKLISKTNSHLFTPNSKYSLVGSCNGLICFSTCYFTELFVSKDPVCVCNPITGDKLNLPRFIVNYPPQEVLDIVNVASGFGYVPFTNEYKVVRICYDGTKALEVQVYTLGGSGSNEGWKSLKGDFDCLMPTDLTPSGVYANGCLYWLNFGEEFSIVAFDLAEEDFYVMSPPSCFPRGTRHRYQLQVLGGLLTFVHQRRGKYVDIWLLDDSSQTKSWGWRKKCRIPWEGKQDGEYEPFAITKMGHVLFWYNKTILSRYDPEARSVTELMYGDDLGFKDFQAIPHTNSFVSLKALGKG